jgi:colicin import membrane protein
MLAPRNTIKTTLLLVLATALLAVTAAGKNERAAQRNALRGAKTNAKAEQQQARAAERQTENQARAEANKQAAAERLAARQADATQKQTKDLTRREASRQVTAWRAAQQADATQKQTKDLARREASRQVTAWRRGTKQAQLPAEPRISFEPQAATREQTTQKRQAMVQPDKEQVRVEQRDVKREQGTQQRTGKTVTRNENRQTKIVNRDANVQRTAGPRDKKTSEGHNFWNTQKTATKNDRTFTKNVSKTKGRDAMIHFDRPRVVRPYHFGSGDYTNHNRNEKFVQVRSYVSGRRPGRIFSHIVWPSYGYPVYYRHGPDLFVYYVRPAYLRKYVFVSIGSYWPSYCSSLRYYWYGWHPYTWYGCYPTAYEVEGDTYNYNYYTYNYSSGTTQDYTTSEYGGPLESVDETTFEDIRQKLAEQSEQQPEPETLVDKFFEDGVAAFEQEDYDTAAAAFANAIELEPNDLIMPFAYVQALFASEQYSKAANILRLALVQMPAEEQGLFFPRGLYSDDEILFGQIDRLQSRAETFVYDPDMSLLLGYQLIGVERRDEARQWLERAGQYELNKDAAVILLDLLDKLEEQPQSSSNNI